jgi:hypothetical protein
MDVSEGTVEEAEEALKRSKAEEAYYYGQYKAGKLDPAPGENTQTKNEIFKKKKQQKQKRQEIED